MSETNKSYRIRTNVGEETGNISIPVSLVQDFDSVDILSLSIKSIDEYKKHSANYGVVVGRVLANNGFGIPNAKISVFIDADSEDEAIMKYLYPYSSSFDENSDKVRYNLLPDEYVSDCHQIVGTFPNKRFMLDNDVLLEVFDKYYKFTTRTNKSGDYLICGVPTGRQTIHMDLDISDCGILSQRPRDFVYKGYNIEQFENPNKFKDGTNYNELSQIFTQDKTINVEPFWGNATDGESIGITRADINVAFKFEPTCVFMGSVVSDNASNGITQKCIATPHMGDMDELTTGEGTIEMIRKTPNGGVEEFQIKGTQLINANGVWCYQIPMNLDYMMTDEYGNMVPTDNPDKGIPTRARVRFRLSLTDNENAKESYYRPKVLVPNNPDFKDGRIDYDYIFGTDTQEDSYRDLFWNNVYSVKSFIPRFQKSRIFKAAWKDEKFTGIKHCNIFGPNNPIPYNNIRFRIPFMFLILCALINAFIRVVGYINVFITATYMLLKFIRDCLDSLGDLLSDVEDTFRILSINLGSGSVYNASKRITNRMASFKYVTIDEGLCPDIEGWYFAPKGIHRQILQQTCVGIDNDLSENGFDNLTYDVKSTGDNNREDKQVCVTNKIDYLITCIEMNLAQEYKVINFDFYNDWINGMIYIPRFKKYIRPKLTFLGFIKIRQKIKGCIDNPSIYDNSRIFLQMCSLKYQLSDYSNKIGSIDKKSKKFYEKESKFYVDIFNNGGVVHEKETYLGQRVYYLKPSERYGRKKINLYSTDLILLGSLNDCDIYGIPQAFKNLTSSSYLLPPNMPITNLEETGPLYAESDDDTYCIKLKYSAATVSDQGTASSIVETQKANIVKDAQTYTDKQLFGDEDPGNVSENGALVDTNTSKKLFKAFSGETGTTFSEDEHVDAIPLTEVSGIAWNWEGPAQFEKDNKAHYLPGGHFLGMACWNIETDLKTCVNLSRICEIGGGMSERREDAREIDRYGNLKYTYNVPTGLISNEAIIDSDFRAMFSSMNQKKLIATKRNKNGYLTYDFSYYRPNGFDGYLSGLIENSSYNKEVTVSSENTSAELQAVTSGKIAYGESYDSEETSYTQTKTLENQIYDYYRFRFGVDSLNKQEIENKFAIVLYGGAGVMPVYENSFYFYFGLKDGATALDEFNKQFFSNCESRLIKDNEPTIDVKLDETEGYNYETKKSKVKVNVKNVELPYDAFIGSFLKKSGEKTQWFEETTNDHIVVESDSVNEAVGLGSYRFKVSFNDGISIENGINVGDDFFDADLSVRHFDTEVTHPFKLEGTYAKDNSIGGCITVRNLNIKYYDPNFASKWKFRLRSKDYFREGVEFCPYCYGTDVAAGDTSGILGAVRNYDCTNCNSTLYQKGRVTGIIYNDIRISSIKAFDTVTNNNTYPESDGVGIVYPLLYGEEQDLSVPYNGEWVVELLYNGEKLKEWGPFNVDHWYSKLYIQNIKNTKVKLPDTFKNFVLKNGEYVEWWKSCSAVNDEYFRNASIDERIEELKYNNNDIKDSTITTDDNISRKIVYGFIQKRVGSNGFSISKNTTPGEGETKLLTADYTYNDRYNMAGGTAPEGVETNYFYITSQNVNNNAYWHTAVPDVKIVNGVVKIQSNSNVWKNYLKVGYPCVFIDTDTNESDIALFGGDNSQSSILNGIVKPLLYYPVLNRPYELNVDLLEWKGLTDTVGDDAGIPDWLGYMDYSNFLSYISTLGTFMKYKIKHPFGYALVQMTCDPSNNGDDVILTSSTINNTYSTIWTGTPVFNKSAKTTGTLKKNKLYSRYTIDTYFKNSENDEDVKRQLVSNVTSDSAIDVYFQNSTGGVKTYLYFGNNPVTTNSQVRYYYFPHYGENGFSQDGTRGTRRELWPEYVQTFATDTSYYWNDPWDIWNTTIYSYDVYNPSAGARYPYCYYTFVSKSYPLLLMDPETGILRQVAVAIGGFIYKPFTSQQISQFYKDLLDPNGTNQYHGEYSNRSTVDGAFLSDLIIYKNDELGSYLTIHADGSIQWGEYDQDNYAVVSKICPIMDENDNVNKHNWDSDLPFERKKFGNEYRIVPRDGWDYDSTLANSVAMQYAFANPDTLAAAVKNLDEVIVNGQTYMPGRRFEVKDSNTENILSYLKDFERDENEIRYTNNIKGQFNEILTNTTITIPAGDRFFNYGVFSVKEVTTPDNQTLKLYKIYPNMLSTDVMQNVDRLKDNSAGT